MQNPNHGRRKPRLPFFFAFPEGGRKVGANRARKILSARKTAVLLHHGRH